jgi:DNA-binding beta-propeller fold protein YncE
MNKVLAVLCGVGMLALGGVFTYISVNKDKPSEKIENTDPRPDPLKIVETPIEHRLVASSFYNPAGVAVQPETGHVFVSMTDRIVRVIPGDPYAVHDEVIGFPNETYGKGPVYEIGPLGLAFADKSTLIVGDGGLDDGADIERIYTVGAQPLPKDKVRTAGDMTSFSAPIVAGPDSLAGEGNFYGIARLGSTVFVTCNGDDTKGWIAKLELDLTKSAPLKLTPFIKSKELTNTNAPMGATITPDGKLLVCQFGGNTTRPDSLLTFYDPLTGRLEKMLTTGLRDLTGIAYSPKTGKLYGVDFSWAEPRKGGLFRLEIVSREVRAERLATLDRPTALAFSPGGMLYVTVIGAEPEKGKRTGQLLVFEGL